MSASSWFLQLFSWSILRPRYSFRLVTSVRGLSQKQSWLALDCGERSAILSLVYSYLYTMSPTMRPQVSGWPKRSENRFRTIAALGAPYFTHQIKCLANALFCWTQNDAWSAWRQFTWVFHGRNKSAHCFIFIPFPSASHVLCTAGGKEVIN